MKKSKETPSLYVPPKWANRFLNWFCSDKFVDEIEGDLYEFYQEERAAHKKWKANLVYWFHVLHFLRPYALKEKRQHSNIITMFKSYFTIALRVIQRNKFYSFLNLSGLSLGLSAAILIFLYVRDEYSFDKYHKDHDRIYRVVTDFKLGDRIIHRPLAPAFMANYMEETIPEIDHTGRLMGGSFSSVVDLGEKQVQIKNATYATSDMLSIFTIPFIKGNPKGALDDPKTVVISESMAAHLFPEEEALGKIVVFNGDNFIIKGIFKDMPENGHFKFDFIMSVMYQDSRFAKDWTWMSINSYTYLKLKKEASPQVVEQKLNEALNTLIAPMIEEVLEVSASDIQANGNHARFYLQPLTDIHLKSNLDREIVPNGSIATVRTIAIIGFILLVIASINFVNLSTARAAVRGKEVGVRKVIGSRRRQLVSQFLFESTLYCFFSFAMAVAIVNFALPFFNQLADKQITHPFGGNPPLWLLMILCAILLGIIAGLYPAFLLSSFKPIKTLKGQNQLQTQGNGLRGALVILQFTISTALIIATLVVNSQLNYISDMTLGFDKDKLLTVGVMDLNRFDSNEEVLKNELLKKPNIESFTISDYIPVGGSRLEMFLKRRDGISIDETITSQAWPVDEDYIPTWGLDIIEGNNFNKNITSDSAISIIINETAAKALQLANPINANLTISYGDQSYDVRVIGLVKDFHYASMRESIKPLFLYKRKDPWTLAVRFNGKASEALATVQQIWENHSGGQPFVGSLISEDYRALYKTENQMKLLINSFSALAIAIAIIGLFGLATFMAEQRKKEMGIRKVLGANVWQLFFNLLKNFTVLIGISCLIAIPLAYMAVSSWLNGFIYRIPLSPIFFIGASLLMLVLAWLTVSYQSIKASIANPVNTLKQD